MMLKYKWEQTLICYCSSFFKPHFSSFTIYGLMSHHVIHQHDCCQVKTRRQYIINNAKRVISLIRPPQATGFIKSPSELQDQLPENPTKQDNNLKRATLISSFLFFSGWGFVLIVTHNCLSLCAKYLFTICSTFRRPRGRIVALDKYGFQQGNHCCGVPLMNKLCCFLSNDPQVSSNTIKAVVKSRFTTFCMSYFVSVVCIRLLKQYAMGQNFGTN